MQRVRSSLWARAGHFVDGNALLLAFCIAVIPNLLFVALSPWFAIRRLISPMVYLCAGLASVFLPLPLAVIVFALAALTDAFFLTALLFEMPIGLTLEAIRYTTTIDIHRSVIYVAAGAYFVIAPVALALIVWRWSNRLRQASSLLATIIASLICASDLTSNAYRPNQLPKFESAMSQNGLTADAIIHGDRNLLLVMVEGLGAYALPEHRVLLSERFAKAAATHHLSSGTSNYYGSTTGAESRELCGQWKTFTYYLGREDHERCIPRLLAQAGFEVRSYHAGSSSVFSRKIWYPRIGIEVSSFLEDIEQDRPQAALRRCGTVFEGMCDVDIGKIVHSDILKHRDQRGFYYWLTLNSHQPYVPVERSTLDCGLPTAPIKERAVCDLTDIWIGIFDEVARIVADPDVPQLDVLIVGDHHTPLIEREAIERFIPGKVDWYFLKDRRPVSPVASPIALSNCCGRHSLV